MSTQSQQHVGQWQSFTDMKSVRGAVSVANNIWAATGGGVFAFDTATGSFKKFTNIDGLDTIDVTTIAYDGTQNIWVGGAGGWVNVYDLQANQWRTIADIANRTESTRKGIQSFSFKGDTIFIVTEFGVSIFRRSRWEFGDTYQNLGFVSPHVTCMALLQNRIWVGTDKGLAVSSIGSGVWTTSASFPGSITSNVTALTVFHDTLIVGTANSIVYCTGNDITPKVIPLLNNRSVSDLRVNNGMLYILSTSGSNFKVETLASVLGIPQTLASNSDVQGTCIIPSSSLWIASASRGLAHLIGSLWTYSYPNGPNSNFFSSIALDDNGVVWAASGSDAHAGFYRYDRSLSETVQWKNFTRDRNPIMGRPDWPNDDYYRISLGANNSVWVSSWGDGVLQVVGDTIRRKLDYYSKPNLPHATADIIPTYYVVTGGVAVDDQGKTWISNRVNGNGRSLLRLDGDSSATYFDNQYNTANGWFHSLAIDHNGTKWLAGDLPWETPGLGVYVFNESLPLNGIGTIGGWGHLSSDDGLASDIVLTFAVDLEGAVWIGTSQGVSILSDPQYPKQISKCFALLASQRIVQSIAVDALNNKWIGTKDGVFVVSPDGAQLLQVYDVASTNGRLLSNDVRTIAIDQKRGIAYFGTEQGLSSLAIGVVQTNRAFTKLEIGPNPFIIQNSSQQLTIRNLVANSTIKILTVSGSVVKQFDAQGGGIAMWDGRDKNGAFVPSGIYFILASAENGSQTVTGKVAIIRR
jgi:ligand-binding sensor domain-containing protein